MQIQVGINENLVIAKVGKNEKGTLIIKVKEATEVDPLAALNAAGSTQLKRAEKDFMIYPLSGTNFDGNPDTFENILKKIAEVKDPLDHIIEQYTTRSNIKWDIFAGLDLTKENMATKLTSQDVLDKVYSNISDQFIKMMEPYAKEDGKKLRFLFIRQSKAKHFPGFRKRFLESQPFVEPMEIPREQSKLAFSDFEKSNGLDSGAPVGGSQSVSQDEKDKVDAAFRR